MRATYVLFWILISLGGSSALLAQDAPTSTSTAYPFRTQAVADSSGNVFFETYPDAITGRLYVSRKYTALQLAGPLQSAGPRLEPFSTLNLGVGASYKGFTLNLATGIGFMNPENGRGETRFLDLQAHAYPKQWVFDFFGQFYTGFHDPAVRLPEGNLLQFPDSRIRKFGLNAQRLLRPERISLRAAFLQTERQVRSGGSP
ncbi:DUF4421 family protein [Nitritalea halalkaliphila]|nr:DUF4421 family protein [Nitritalea halalkaliphila]